MKYSVLVIALLVCSCFFGGTARADYIQKNIKNAEIVGSGRMSYMVWDLYDATLYAPKGVYNQEKPYALSLTYLRNLRGDKIAQRSVQEMRNNGVTNEVTLQSWLKTLEDIFPDVVKGDVISGLRNKEGHTEFFVNAVSVAVIKDPIFTESFFGIWLGNQTSVPKLKAEILGQG